LPAPRNPKHHASPPSKLAPCRSGSWAWPAHSVSSARLVSLGARPTSARCRTDGPVHTSAITAWWFATVSTGWVKNGYARRAILPGHYRGSAASNNLAGNTHHCDRYIREKGLVGDGVTDRTAINPGSLISGIALITWLPGRKRLFRDGARPPDGVSRCGSPAHLRRFLLWCGTPAIGATKARPSRSPAPGAPPSCRWD
jgi:hypothetical protein